MRSCRSLRPKPINNNAAMGFSFGLVEVALYGFGDGSLAIQPRAVAKTRMIEKTVVVLRDPDGAPVAGDIDVSATGESVRRSATGEGEKQAEYRAWYKPILEMTFDDPDQEPPKLYWPNNVRVHLPWPKTWLLAASVATGRRCFVWLVEGGQEKSLAPLLGAMREEILAQLPPGVEAREVADGTIFGIDRPWSSFADEEEQKAWMDAFRAIVYAATGRTGERPAILGIPSPVPRLAGTATPPPPMQLGGAAQHGQ
jgi:hypothetical protein